MNKEYEYLKNEITKVSIESMECTFHTFKNLKNFDKFCFNCISEGVEKFVCKMEYFSKSNSKEYIIQNMIEIIKNDIFAPAEKMFEYQLEMFSYNTDNDMVLDYMKNQEYAYNKIKEYLMIREEYEIIEKINNNLKE